MEKFNSLDEEKKQKILDAALREFAEQGYEKASTNRIVKEAGIGKGMLFYYFNSKKDLYEYLVDYSMDVIINDYYNLVDTSEKDFIERIKQAAEVKLKAQSENSQAMNFIGTFMLAKEVELSPHLQQKYEELWQRGNDLIYEGIDVSLFRSDVDVKKAFKLIQWSIDGYQKELLQKHEGQKISAIDLEFLWNEFYEYLEILKKSFYKEGERER